MKDKPTTTKARKKPNILVRLLAFLVTVALVLGAVALVVYRDKLNFDALRRAITYRTLSKSDSGQADSFPFESTAHDSYATAGGNLLVASLGGVRLYSGSGTEYVNQQAAMQNPIVDAVGSWSLAWDAGGSAIYAFRGKELAYSLTMEEGNTLLSARLNSSGYLALITQVSGLKGAVTAYDPSGTRVITLNLSSSFVMDALVTEDNKELAVITAGEGGGSFESRLNLYVLENQINGQDPVLDTSCSLGSSLPLDFSQSNAGLWVLGDQSVSLVGLDGAAMGTYDYAGRYLKEFSLDGDDFAVLLLGKYRAGTLADLVVVDTAGRELGSLDMSEQVLSLSAAGRYIAVLGADKLVIYTSDLTPYATLDGTQGAQTVLMRADGSAMLLTETTARLYIPQ